jgi:hypothetical protein
MTESNAFHRKDSFYSAQCAEGYNVLSWKYMG